MSAEIPELDELISHLRHEGLWVGSREILRLQRAFELEPDLEAERDSSDQVKSLFAAALVHSPEDRKVFDRVYSHWESKVADWMRRGDRKALIDDDQPLAPRAPAIPEKPESAWRRFWNRWRGRIERVLQVVVMAAVLGFAAWRIFLQSESPVEKTTALETLPAAALDAPEGLEPVDLGPPPTTFTDWQPTITVTNSRANLLRSQLPIGLLGLLSLGAALYLWQIFRDLARTTTAPAPALPGPSSLPLLPLGAAGPELLDSESARTIIWGVERHLSEEVTQQLDIDRTVERTAQGAGMPHLEYQQASELRQVWLWVDGSAEDPAIEAFCDEILQSLARAGLPARIGGFDAVPEEVLWDEGHRIHPDEVEAQRQSAMVAVCTDGQVLVSQLSDSRGGPLQHLLRALALWPRLAFVDFSRGSSGLKAALEPFGIPVLAPEDIPDFFGVRPIEIKAEPRRVDLGELRRWAACLALSTRPVDRRAAYSLRRDLGLKVTAWSFRRLLEEKLALDDESNPIQPVYLLGNRLELDPSGRRWLLNWLQEADASTTLAGRLRSGSTLERALAFWQHRLAVEAQEREAREEIESWQGTAAQCRLELEQAQLLLWRAPEEAAAKLWEMRARFGDEITKTLEKLTPADLARPGDSHTRLPWTLESLAGEDGERARFELAELGLAGLREGSLHRPGRLGAGIGLLLGLGVSLLAVVAFPFLNRSASDPQLRVMGSAIPPSVHAYPGDDVRPLAGDLLVAGTPWSAPAFSTVPGGATVTVTWQPLDRPCRERIGQSEIWRCGSSPKQPTVREAMEWPQQSLALFLFPSDHETARAAATVLLDSGSVDALLLGTDAADHFASLAGPPLEGATSGDGINRLKAISASGFRRQLLIFLPEGTGPAELAFEGETVVLQNSKGLDVPAALADRLPKIDGGRPILDVLPRAALFPSDGPAQDTVKGAPEPEPTRLANCPYQEARHPGTGMVFVRVCTGSFKMGSEPDEPGAAPDEAPAHEVKLSGFWISRNEVTNEQFRKADPDLWQKLKASVNRPEEIARPMSEISWDKARTFCQNLGLREWSRPYLSNRSFRASRQSGVSDSEYDLPTEAEWEYAARGHGRRTYPWGSTEPSADLAVFGGIEPADVGTHPRGAAPFGAEDMAGNVREWVRDWYGGYSGDPQIDPQGPPSGENRVLRGGSFIDDPRNLRSAIRIRFRPEDRLTDIGFRCVRRPVPQPAAAGS